MINLVLTNTIDSKYILDKVKKDYKKGVKQLIIVPDRVVLAYEMMVLEYLDIQGSFDIEVVSFSTLADRVLGKNADLMLNTQTEIMVIRKIIEDNRGKLLFYRESSKYIGFANEVLNLLGLLRVNSITLDTLVRLQEQLPAKYKNKLHDILLIYKEYKNCLTNKYSDSISKIEALVEKLPDSNYSNHKIYISEFLDFSKLELDVIEALAKFGTEMYISLPYSDADNKSIYPTTIKDKISNIAKRVYGNDISCKITREEEKLIGDFARIHDYLYSYKTPQDPMTSGNVAISSYMNPEKEVRDLAIRIKLLIKNQNIRYKDIAVVCCDLNNYYSTIQSTFKRYDIPFYADAKSQLVDQNLTRILLAAFRTIMNGYSQEDVLCFTKELDSILDKSDIYDFENYCLKFGIEYSNRIKSPFTQVSERFYLEPAERIRKKIVAMLEPLENIQGKRVSDYLSAIKAFLEKIDAENISKVLSNEQLKAGYKVEASVTDQVLEKIYVVIDQMDSMLGECEMTIKEFYKIFETTINSMSVSTIPMYIDCVYIGDCEKTRYEKKKFLFIIGANDSLFPIEYADGGLLTSQEFEWWNQNDAPIYPNTQEANKASKLYALMVMLKPSVLLTISYSRYDLLGNKLQKSSTISYLYSILGIKEDEEVHIYEPQTDWSLEQFYKYYVCEGSALEDLIDLNNRIKDNLLEYKNNVPHVMNALYTIACKKFSKEKVDKIINSNYRLETSLNGDYDGLPNSNVSVSKFEKYLSCPFRYYADYILRLREREVAGVQIADTGILMHAVMEQFFKQKDYDLMSYDEINSFVEKVFFDCLQDEDNKAFRYLLDDEYKINRSEFISATSNSLNILVNKMRVSKFKPYKLESKFSNYKGPKDYDSLKLVTSKKTFDINGVIDRIDKFGNEGFIVDYKSKSSMDFSFKNVFYGERVQLLVYLKKLIDEEKITPAGVFYLLVNQKYSSASTVINRLKYNGFIVSDKSIVRDLDENFCKDEDYKSELFPIKQKYSKDTEQEELEKTTGGSLVTVEELNAMCDYVMKLVAKAADEIQEGYVKATPYSYDDGDSKACTYCPYINMCQIKTHRGDIRRLGNNDFAQEVMFGKKEVIE